MGKIKFDRASQVNEKKSTDFFETKRQEGEKPSSEAPAKKIRVFVDMTAEELQQLDKLVMEQQLVSSRVIYRSKIAKELLMEAIKNKNLYTAALTTGQCY